MRAIRFPWPTLMLGLLCLLAPAGSNAQGRPVVDYRFDLVIELASEELVAPGAAEPTVGFDVQPDEMRGGLVLRPVLHLRLGGPCADADSLHRASIPGGEKGLWAATYHADCESLTPSESSRSQAWRLVLRDPVGRPVRPGRVRVEFTDLRVDRESADGRFALRVSGTFVAAGFRIVHDGQVVGDVGWEDDPERVARHMLVARVPAEHGGEAPGAEARPASGWPQRVRLRAAAPSTGTRAPWAQVHLLLRPKDGTAWTRVSAPSRAPAMEDTLELAIPAELIGRELEALVVVGRDGQMTPVPIAAPGSGGYSATLTSSLGPSPLLDLALPRVPTLRFSVRALDGEGRPVEGAVVTSGLMAGKQALEETAGRTDEDGRVEHEFFAEGGEWVRVDCAHPDHALSHGTVPDVRELLRTPKVVCPMRRLERPIEPDVAAVPKAPRLLAIQLSDHDNRQPVSGGRVTVRLAGKAAGIGYSDDEGWALIPLAAETEPVVVSIEASCYEPIEHELDGAVARTAFHWKLRTACVVAKLSLRLTDARRGEPLAPVPGARVTLRQGERLLAERVPFEEGFAYQELRFERGAEPLEIHSEVPGHRAEPVQIAELAEGFREIDIPVLSARSGVMVLINAAENWRHYVDARTIIAQVLRDRLSSGKLDPEVVALGAFGSAPLVLPWHARSRDPAQLGEALRQFSGITASRGLFRLSHLEDLVAAHGEALTEAGDWSVILVVPHNHVLGGLETLDDAVVGRLVQQLREAGIRLSVIEDGGKTEELTGLCEHLGGVHQVVPADEDKPAVLRKAMSRALDRVERPVSDKGDGE